MNIGIVFNPSSGDQDKQKLILDDLKNVLKEHKVYCTKSTQYFISEYLTCDIVPDVFDVGCTINHSVKAGMALKNIELVLVLGGDGTVSDVVYGQRLVDNLIPILGIACGTVNAGPLISFSTTEELKENSIIEGAPKYIMGIDAYDIEGRLLGTAFNDIVFSDSIVTTKNKKVETVNAEKFILGEKIPSTPYNVGKKNTEIDINGNKIDPEHNIGQIIVSAVINSEYYKAKAITGKLCWIPYTEKKAIMVISKQPIIKIAKPEDYNPIEPLLLSQYLFGSEDTVRISKTKGYLIIDGNPKLSMDNNECFLKLNKKAALKYDF
ncbi:MAG: diacylglycerol kinase family protein [Kosmotogaceae bacterium]